MEHEPQYSRVSNSGSAAGRPAVILPGEPTHQRFAALVGGEEALDPELVERDVVWDAEARQRGEERQAQVVSGELDGEEGRRGRVEIERAPLARHVGVRAELIQQARCVRMPAQ